MPPERFDNLPPDDLMFDDGFDPNQGRLQVKHIYNYILINFYV